jgi:hypothetical protein
VSDSELLARFVLFSGWFRANGTVKQDAFIPPPNLQLSVTRHTGLSESELWDIGLAVAEARPARFYGRADLLADSARNSRLKVESTPTPKNHANITGWPGDKPAQKIIALELAAAATWVAHR